MTSAVFEELRRAWSLDERRVRQTIFDCQSRSSFLWSRLRMQLKFVLLPQALATMDLASALRTPACVHSTRSRRLGTPTTF